MKTDPVTVVGLDYVLKKLDTTKLGDHLMLGLVMLKFHLANRVVVKPKMFLLRKQVVVSCDQENVLDKVRDEAAMELVVKLTFVIAVVARVESFHQEQRR